MREERDGGGEGERVSVSAGRELGQQQNGTAVDEIGRQGLNT